MTYSGKGRNLTIPVSVVRPSSRENPDRTESGMAALAKLGFAATYFNPEADPRWGYTAGSTQSRWDNLSLALNDSRANIIWCARGGYGASDLLDCVDWDQRPTSAKMMIGFSDISALHAAFWTKWNWPGLHAPMPATTLWPTNDQTVDVQHTAEFLQTWNTGGTHTQQLELTPIGGHAQSAPCSGTLFGGCFSVLTNLIGTPFLPNSFADHILFFEDTGENPGRLLRHLNQWRQSGLLKDVRAVIFGHLRDLGGKHPDCDPQVYERMANAIEVPCFHSPLFGHTAPNMPMLVGADAMISNSQLTWTWAKNSQDHGANT